MLSSLPSILVSITWQFHSSTGLAELTLMPHLDCCEVLPSTCTFHGTQASSAPEDIIKLHFKRNGGKNGIGIYVCILMSIYNLLCCSVVQLVLNFHLTGVNGEICKPFKLHMLSRSASVRPMVKCKANTPRENMSKEWTSSHNVLVQKDSPNTDYLSLPGTKWSQNVLLHFFVSRENPQPNNKWLDGNGHIHSFTLRGKQVSQSSGVAQYLPVHNLPGLGTQNHSKLPLENAWGWLRVRTICRHTHFPRQPYHVVKHTSIDSFWESWLNGSSAKYRTVCIYIYI